jgi:hypothetical protein
MSAIARLFATLVLAAAALASPDVSIAQTMPATFVVVNISHEPVDVVIEGAVTVAALPALFMERSDAPVQVEPRMYHVVVRSTAGAVVRKSADVVLRDGPNWIVYAGAALHAYAQLAYPDDAFFVATGVAAGVTFDFENSVGIRERISVGGGGLTRISRSGRIDAHYSGIMKVATVGGDWFGGTGHGMFLPEAPSPALIYSSFPGVGRGPLKPWTRDSSLAGGKVRFVNCSDARIETALGAEQPGVQLDPLVAASSRSVAAGTVAFRYRVAGSAAWTSDTAVVARGTIHTVVVSADPSSPASLFSHGVDRSISPLLDSLLGVPGSAERVSVAWYFRGRSTDLLRLELYGCPSCEPFKDGLAGDDGPKLQAPTSLVAGHDRRWWTMPDSAVVVVTSGALNDSILALGTLDLAPDAAMRLIVLSESGQTVIRALDERDTSSQALSELRPASVDAIPGEIRLLYVAGSHRRVSLRVAGELSPLLSAVRPRTQSGILGGLRGSIAAEVIDDSSASVLMSTAVVISPRALTTLYLADADSGMIATAARLQTPREGTYVRIVNLGAERMPLDVRIDAADGIRTVDALGSGAISASLTLPSTTARFAVMRAGGTGDTLVAGDTYFPLPQSNAKGWTILAAGSGPSLALYRIGDDRESSEPILRFGAPSGAFAYPGRNASGLRLSPNPAVDRVRVQASARGRVTIDLVDALGNRRRSWAIIGKAFVDETLDLGGLESGVYRFVIRGSDDSISSGALVVRH